MHRDAIYQIDGADGVPVDVTEASQHAWEVAVRDGEEYGVRNSQASVLAPTGTIGLMMDCDTTGIEPDLGLVKFKKLVGGGNMQIVNQTVPRALRKLNYTTTQIDDIVAYIDREDDPRRTAPGGRARRCSPARWRQHDPLRGSRA
jgi:ribonucleoside-diphosphate reductase alpha chain